MEDREAGKRGGILTSTLCLSCSSKSDLSFSLCFVVYVEDSVL